jgi:hypothetical protein
VQYEGSFPWHELSHSLPDVARSQLLLLTGAVSDMEARIPRMFEPTAALVRQQQIEGKRARFDIPKGTVRVEGMFE